MPKLLVTGHSGFVGQSVLRHLASGEAGLRWQLATLPEELDLRAPGLDARIAAMVPDCVLHLAARTSVAESFRDVEGYLDVNLRGTLNLLRALRACGFAGRFVHVGSGDCYGAVPESELPIAEERPLRPRSPYAVSKIASEALCYQWTQSEALDAVLARPFNHIGPGQDLRFAAAAFARQVTRIKAGRAEPRLSVGDLDVTRDFTDVRDVVRAYFALLEGGRRGEAYNIGSGRETRLSELLARMLAQAGVEASIEIDAARVRADEQRRVVADVRRIASDTGWKAQIPLDRTIRDTLDYWTGRIADE